MKNENEDRIKDLIIQLNQLNDEHEILMEEYDRLEIQDDPEGDAILSEAHLLEKTIAKLEEELELLR
ncbi:MAG: hypothetical protein WCT77_01945 [Bacteroidota bacterium]